MPNNKKRSYWLTLCRFSLKYSHSIWRTVHVYSSRWNIGGKYARFSSEFVSVSVTTTTPHKNSKYVTNVYFKLNDSKLATILRLLTNQLVNERCIANAIARPQMVVKAKLSEDSVKQALKPKCLCSTTFHVFLFFLVLITRSLLLLKELPWGPAVNRNCYCHSTMQ